jgi:hypothetical protein
MLLLFMKESIKYCMSDKTPNPPIPTPSDDPCDDVTGTDLSKWCKKTLDK